MYIYLYVKVVRIMVTLGRGMKKSTGNVCFLFYWMVICVYTYVKSPSYMLKIFVHYYIRHIPQFKKIGLKRMKKLIN